MRKLAAGLLAITAISPASAQLSLSPVSAGPSGNEYGTANLRAASYGLRGTLETPTMRRQKLARAIALRDEALLLQQADGGTLTGQHQRYVQRKAHDILAYAGTQPGLIRPPR